MAPRSVSEWQRHPELMEAAVKGFDHLSALPKILAEEFDWLKPMDFCFSSKDDIPQMFAVGWDHLKRSDFDMVDVESFNKAVPLRFGLSDDGYGNLKFGENWMMIRPLSLTDEIAIARSKAAQASLKTNAESKLYVDPHDPRGRELVANPDLVHASLSMNTINPTSARPEPKKEAPKRRGRPRRKKE